MSKSHKNRDQGPTAVADRKSASDARWHESRRRMQALLETDPEFAEEARQAMASVPPEDDPLLKDARDGVFGDAAHRERYGA